MNSSPKSLFCASILAVFAALLASCGPTRPAPEKPGAPPPLLEKTHGNLSLGDEQEVRVSYKSIHLAVDPVSSGPAPFRGQLDYLLITNGSAANRLKGVSGLRKDQKIICPDSAVSMVRAAGFVNVKGLGDGQKLLLQKDDGHTFVSLSILGEPDRAGYFLEFDSGRNVYISGPSSHPDHFRPFLYRIRDEGKPIHLAVINALLLEPRAEKGSETLALLQPQVGIIHGNKFTAEDEASLHSFNEANLFFGRAEVAASGDDFDF